MVLLEPVVVVAHVLEADARMLVGLAEQGECALGEFARTDVAAVLVFEEGPPDIVVGAEEVAALAGDCDLANEAPFLEASGLGRDRAGACLQGLPELGARDVWSVAQHQVAHDATVHTLHAELVPHEPHLLDEIGPAGIGPCRRLRAK